MTGSAPAVALLFDDTELGSQLRDALHEQGARIVHEGGVSSLSRELLDKVGAEVLVINLDDAADDALDQLYAVIDGDRPRVVFNDAQASRALVGWDRARWARHLAVKVLAAGDVDPPRPEDARHIDLPAPSPQPGGSVTSEADAAAGITPAAIGDDAANAVDSADPATAAWPLSDPPTDLSVHDDLDAPQDQTVSAESENLAAELEALLASGDLPVDDEVAHPGGLRFADGEELLPLHDGHFGMPAETFSDEPLTELEQRLSAAVDAAEENTSSPAPPVFQLDHLQLAPVLDASTATQVTGADTTVAAVPDIRVVAPPRAHDNWALLDDDTPASDATEMPDATAFGIEKLSAAEFLAPIAAPASAGSEPTMSLQLVSLEEAIAPQAYQPVSEMLLDDTGTGLSRIVLLGAAASGAPSVGAFLGALPPTTRLTFLLVQHLGAQSAETVAEQLAAGGNLPVRVAGHGGYARPGEVLVVPEEQVARVYRDGRIELQPGVCDPQQSPSIDASFTLAANAFGRDALAIVFAGRATDAVAGSQAIHDRGGQVWVESSSSEHFADMVSGIFAERLVSFSGTSHELAAHLIEVYP